MAYGPKITFNNSSYRAWLATQPGQFIAAIRTAALEAAARECEVTRVAAPFEEADYFQGCEDCAEAIRALIESPATQ
jgi:hypothetical protein